MTANPRLVLLGRQGSGKGTQSARIADHLGVPHLSTGELFRAAVAADTPVGRCVADLLATGQLVPDELVLDVVRTESARQCWDATGFVLDGFPRTVGQAEAFFGEPHIDLAAAPTQGSPSFDAAVLLEVPRPEVRRRMASRRVCPTCGATVTVADPSVATAPCPNDDGVAVRRADDLDEVIEQRLDLYERETALLVPWFEAWGRLAVVDGTGHPDAVFARLSSALEPLVGQGARRPG